MPNVDDLSISITSKADSANDALDRLISKLDRLTSALEKVNGSAINGLANSIEKLGKSMQVVNSVKTSDFTRLTRNIEKLSQVNTASLNTSASAINILSKSVNSLGNVSQQAQQIGILASNLSKLGYKSIATASQNIPQLATALKQLMVTLSSAPRINLNIVAMTNALANLAGQLKGVKATTATSKASFNGLANSMSKATRSSFSLAAAFGKFYASYFLVIRAIKGLWKSVEDTSDYIEAFNYFDVAFEKVAREWKHDFEKYAYENADAYAKSFEKRMSESMAKLSGVKVEIDEDGLGLLTSSGMKNLGLNIQEITQYASQLASVTNSLGQTGETSLAIADSFTKLAGDISSLFNIDYNTVAKSLQSGLLGQSRALYKFGIDITNATLQTYAYELGLEKTVSEMTQMEKQQLRVMAILDQSKVSWGDLANTINSPSNMIRQLTNNLKEAGMVLGQLFVPAVEKILPVINGFSIAIKQLLVDFAGIMGIKINFKEFGKGYTELEEELDGLENGLENATESANKLKNALRGFDKLNVLSSGQRGLNASLGQSFDLTDQIKKATEEYNKMWNDAFANMENKAQEFSKKISKALEPIKTIFNDFVIGDYFKLGNDVSELVISITDFLRKAIESVNWDEVGKNIGEFLRGMNWTKILESIGKLIWSAINAGIKTFKSTFESAPVETTIVTALLGLKFTGLGVKLAGNLAGKIKDAIVFAFSNPTLFTAQFMGTPAFDVLATEILGHIESAMKNLLPEWVNKLLGNMVAGMTAGAIAGSWLPGLGTFAGAVVGAIIGAFNGIEVDGKSIMKIITEKLFNWDVAQWLLRDAADKLNLAFSGEKRNFIEIGKLVIEGIAEGILGYVTILTEPIGDLLAWIAEALTLDKIFEDLMQGLKDSWNSFATDLNKHLTWTIEPMYVFGNKIFDGTTISLGKIPTFMNGGFPEDGWFRASKGEYFGSFDDGTSVIANNNQIISGIANGVRSANSDQNALLREQNALLRQILAKDTGISSRDVFNAVRTEDRNYSLRNGQSAFAY